MHPDVARLLPVGEDGDGDRDKFINRNGINAWLEHTHLKKAQHGLRWKAQQIARLSGNTDADKQAVLLEATKWATNIKDAAALNIFYWPTVGETLGKSPPTWLLEFGKELGAGSQDNSEQVTSCPIASGMRFTAVCARSSDSTSITTRGGAPSMTLR